MDKDMSRKICAGIVDSFYNKDKQKDENALKRE